MLKKLLKPVSYFLLTALMILKLPELHYSLLRSYVSSKVVKITNQTLNHGGTGVHVKTPHGSTFILTNAHVCRVAENGFVWVTSEEGITIPRRVIESSNFTDLCLIEGMPGKSGLSLGNEPEVGDIEAVIGHPKLMPTTVSRGEIIGTTEVDVMDHVITDPDSDRCDMPKNKIEEIMSMFGLVRICLIHIKAYLSNIVILPGNSGSPMVNKYGSLVGLAFAGDDDVHWGCIVILSDIEKFLSPY